MYAITETHEVVTVKVGINLISFRKQPASYQNPKSLGTCLLPIRPVDRGVYVFREH